MKGLVFTPHNAVVVCEVAVFLLLLIGVDAAAYKNRRKEIFRRSLSITKPFVNLTYRGLRGCIPIEPPHLATRRSWALHTHAREAPSSTFRECPPEICDLRLFGRRGSRSENSRDDRRLPHWLGPIPDT
jgi:hypothetical protein